VSDGSSSVIAKDMPISVYRQLWRQVINPDFRDGNIYGASSRLVSHWHGKNRSASIEQPLWELTERVNDDLVLLEQSVVGSVLPNSVKSNVLALVHTFKASLMFPETSTEAKELLPVLIQFSRMLAESALLGKYLKQHVARREFAEDMRVFLRCLQLAIEGRMEQRQILYRAHFPNALPAGASSLLSCYTAVFYLCWEIFTRDRGLPAREEGQNGNQGCLAESFAGLVYAGREGRVRCGELFTHFREYVEKARSADRGSHGSLSVTHLQSTDPRTPSDGTWSSRICFFEVPGSLLLRTEQVFAHALHEAAELSEWAQHPRNTGLRSHFNFWITTALAHAIYDAVDNLLVEDPGRCVDSSKCRLEFCSHLAAYLASICVDEPIQRPRDDISEDRLMGRIKNVYANSVPSEFFGKLYDTTVACGADPEVVIHTESIFYSLPSNAPLDTSVFADALNYSLKSVLVRFRFLVEAALELIPDIAMWTALRRVLKRDDDVSLASDVADLNRIYSSLYRSACEGAQEGMTVGRSVLIRWAVMASSLLHGHTSHGPGHETWEKIVLEGLSGMRRSDIHNQFPSLVVRELRKQMEFAATLFDNGNETALDVIVSRFTSFGGPVEVWTCDTDDEFSTAEILLLKRFQAAWNAQEIDKERVTLAFHFWAKAQRLRHHRMFQLT